MNELLFANTSEGRLDMALLLSALQSQAVTFTVTQSQGWYVVTIGK